MAIPHKYLSLNFYFAIKRAFGYKLVNGFDVPSNSNVQEFIGV